MRPAPKDSRLQSERPRGSQFAAPSVRRAVLNPREAKCCCVCAHWHKHGAMDGQCRNPKLRHGVTYKDERTGEETHIEWLTTGCYHSCQHWRDVSTPNADVSASGVNNQKP